ncbi:ComEA family DNA-binding protein [Mycolicibacterium litorale]|uniref:DNA-binding protein n=1 Tax=Mycolicibacterium litorale TaxID=758802 RepID=A0AAD1IGN9_9MYCO|nr:ComEA family DNA-binding protein [Mycolicibacterium litorale]MCV7413746.1 ComEA family DNA-binding protein [Mycolicibacterium litorale]TDY03371.1 competence protein ComEA [Mycolicibacterium litorale]BBY15167.1 DNA-binding protein [Mycolicibacterium litorale]
MRTEEPAERLHRRLGAEEEPDQNEARPDTALSRWLPDTATPDRPGWLATVRADPGRAGVVGLAVVGVLAVLVTVFTLWRDDPPPVVAAKLPEVEMVSSAAPKPGPPGPDQPVVVSVVGLVHRPGLVTLAAGARIADALEAAGGAVDGADLIGLNMARRLTDGEQIIVGIAPAPGQPATMGSSTTGADATGAAPSDSSGSAPAEKTGSPGEPVNLNTATVEQLDTLPGVGPVTAAAIVAWRDANGPFGSVDQLGEVDGIGPARLARLRELVYV